MGFTEKGKVRTVQSSLSLNLGDQRLSEPSRDKLAARANNSFHNPGIELGSSERK